MLRRLHTFLVSTLELCEAFLQGLQCAGYLTLFGTIPISVLPVLIVGVGRCVVGHSGCIKWMPRIFPDMWDLVRVVVRRSNGAVWRSTSL
jgi:sterol desaturase/sphingolipid hydroxylase (fatty acid hydroxylase superfamily)